MRGNGFDLVLQDKNEEYNRNKLIIKMVSLLKNFKFASLGMILFITPFISHQKINASNYWTCENEDGFISVFKINTNPAYVTHVSSYNPENDDEWFVNKPLQVVFSNNNVISSVDVYIEDEAIYLDIFNLNNKTFISKETFFDGSEGITQNYKCV